MVKSIRSEKLKRRSCLLVAVGSVFTLMILMLAQGPAASTAKLQEPGAPGAPCGAIGLLEKSTVFSVYGRAFDRAPILGHLGTYKSFDMMAADIPKWTDEIKQYNDKKTIVPGVHLIYAMASPCLPHGDCLNYLEGAVPNIVDAYIKPAAARGWIVVLDTQVARSNPVDQIRRMIEKGYLKYDNVHVAIDPEFRLYPDKPTPGVPIGTVDAAQINEVQKILDGYVKSQCLKTKKILIVHQFGDGNIKDGVPFMIENKKDLKTFDNVELVVDMDGLGTPELKVWKYNRITDTKVYPSVKFGAIKVFYPNQWEKAGHYDKPPMTMEQVFGIQPVLGRLRMAVKPNIVIIA